MADIITAGAPESGAAALALRLNALADRAAQASSDVTGSYLLDAGASRADDIARGASQAAGVRAGVQHLLTDIAVLDGGEDGLTAAFRSIEEIGDGLATLESGVVVGDVVGPGVASAIIDETAPKEAGQKFASAAESLRGVAALAHLEHLEQLPGSVLDDAIRIGLRL